MAISDEAAMLLSDALPAAAGRLMELAVSSDEKVARRAVDILVGYLGGPSAMRATIALGTAEAAEMHLQALDDLQAMRARLGAVRGRTSSLA